MPEFVPVPPAATAAPWGRGISMLVLGVLVATELYFMFTAKVRASEHLQLGCVMIFLAFLPAYLWARRGRSTLPVFEVILFTTLNTYGLPLLNGHENLNFYSESDITAAAISVIIFQLAAIATYQLFRGRASLSPFWREEIITRDIARILGYGLLLNTLYIILSTFTRVIPSDLMSILRAVFFGIGIISVFTLSRRLGLGQLSSFEKVFFALNLSIQVTGMIATLFLVGAVSTLLLALIGYISARGRIPVVICVLLFVTIALLHAGKSPMRDKYWKGSVRTVPTMAELPNFFFEWIQYGLASADADTEQDKKITSKLVERTSLIHILCLVTNRSPQLLPHLDGETYADIPAQFVPRIFWSDKPLGHVSNTRLSVYYGLQTEAETATTTIGFGMLAEAYANFGYFGLGALGVLVGFVIKRAQTLSNEGPIFSYGGLLLVLLLAWSFQVEFTLSMWIASFYQACIAVLGLPFLLKKFLP